MKSHGRNVHLSTYKATFCSPEFLSKTKMTLCILNCIFKSCKINQRIDKFKMFLLVKNEIPETNKS